MADICPCCKRPLDKLDSGLVVSLDCNTVSRNGAGARLPPRLAVILHALYQRYPKSVHYDYLHFALSGQKEPKSKNLVNVMKVRVSNLRRMIKPLGIAIKNDYGVGYRLELL